MPPVEAYVSEDDRSTVNPLGVKGAGEDGTVGAGAAVANAVEDALAHLGVKITTMPLSPSRVLALIQEVGARAR
jgi:CO/xanthine dehydrogenase Mo-binding subunit